MTARPRYGIVALICGAIALAALSALVALFLSGF